MKHYITHNCSITVHVRDNEWDLVEQWLWDNWDEVIAISFIGYDDSFYQLLPYEAITQETYEELASKLPKFNPNILRQYETFEDEFDILDADCESGACPVR